MSTWLFVTLIFMALIIFLIFIVWLDWKFKCRKTAKENKMTSYVNGYAVVGDDSNVYIISGLLGVNSEELVFGHRFKDDAENICQNISDVSGIEILKYDGDTFLRLVREWCNIHGNIARYVVINMAGISTSKRIPKLVQSRTLCKINVNDRSFLFCLKDTDNNIETLNKIKSDICSN